MRGNFGRAMSRLRECLTSDRYDQRLAAAPAFKTDLPQRALDLSQQAIGTKAGVSVQAWNNYAKALRCIDIDRAIQLETARRADPAHPTDAGRNR